MLKTIIEIIGIFGIAAAYAYAGYLVGEARGETNAWKRATEIMKSLKIPDGIAGTPGTPGITGTSGKEICAKCNSEVDKENFIPQVGLCKGCHNEESADMEPADFMAKREYEI